MPSFRISGCSGDTRLYEARESSELTEFERLDDLLEIQKEFK